MIFLKALCFLETRRFDFANKVYLWNFTLLQFIRLIGPIGILCSLCFALHYDCIISIYSICKLAKRIWLADKFRDGCLFSKYLFLQECRKGVYGEVKYFLVTQKGVYTVIIREHSEIGRFEF